MKQQTRYPGCEEHEIPIGHLSPGAVFVLDLGRGKRNGIVVSRNAGSVTVEWQNGAAQHCCVDCPVVPTGLVQDVEQWIQNQKSNEEVNTVSKKTEAKKKRKSSIPGVTVEMLDAYRKSRTAPTTMTAHDRELVKEKGKLHREHQQKKTGAKKVGRKRRTSVAKTAEKAASASFRIRRKAKK